MVEQRWTKEKATQGKAQIDVTENYYEIGTVQDKMQQPKSISFQGDDYLEVSNSMPKAGSYVNPFEEEPSGLSMNAQMIIDKDNFAKE